MKLFFCGLLPVLISFIGYSQISGNVTNNKTSEAIEEVRIYAPQLDYVTYSDENGVFLINTTTLPLTLVVSRLGYETQSLMVRSNSISISLSPTVFEMEEVIVSTPFSNLQNQNTISVTKISSEAIEEGGASVLAEALQAVPGVSVVSSGPGVAKPVIRGLSSNRVVTYVNDLRYENYQFGAEHGLDLGASTPSVEIIKGPFSLLYGSDAIGGVVYVSPQLFTQSHSPSGSVRQRYLSQSIGTETNATLGVAAGSWQFGVSGSHMQHADYKTASKELVPNSRFNSKGGGFNTRFAKGNYQAIIRFAYSDKQAGIVEERTGGKRDAHLSIPFQETQLNQMSLRQKLSTSLGLWDVTTGFTLNKRREFEHHDEGDHQSTEKHIEGALLNMSNNVFSVDLRNTLPTKGTWKQMAGIQWLTQQNKNIGEEQIIPNATQRDVGLFWLHQFSTNNTNWQFGLRYDNRRVDTEAFVIHDHADIVEKVGVINENFSSFNGSIGFTRSFSENTQIRLNASTGYRAPNLAELTSHGVHHGAQRFEVGNATLSAEKNLQVDLGFDLKTTYLNLGVDGFYNNIQNYIFLNPTADFKEGLQVFAYEQTGAFLWGGEFYAHYHPKGKLHFESSLAYVRGMQKDKTSLPLIPPFVFHQEVHWELSSAFAAFLSLDLVDNQNKVSVFETKTAAYEVINMGAHLDIPLNNATELRIQALIRNLGNRNYIPHLSRLKGIGVEQPGRNLVLSATLQF